LSSLGGKLLSAIAGAVLVDGREISDNFLAKMAGAAAKRGYDGVTRWHAGPAGMIRFAHATTPEAAGEIQPFVSDQSGAVICFDGRLDNRAELIALLGPRGATLKAAPDGEIALAMFERAGDDFAKALVGDFAIAIWQPHERRLFCVRSPMGWRPLLWTFDGSCFAFATEPRALVVGLDLHRRLNEGAIGEYLSGRIVNQTETFWKGINRLPGGSALAFEKGRVRTWHWHDEQYDDLHHLSDAEHIERFNALFDQALIACARSNTPVTAQLSGGLDSSSVVCRAIELHRSGRLQRPIEAITARYPGEPHDETAWSKAVEAHLGIEAKVVGDLPFDLDAAQDWCATTLLLPLRPTTLGMAQAVVRRMQADGSRVMLTGEGGDDWMNGSRAHWPDLLRRGRIGTLLKEGLSQGPGRSLASNLRSLLSQSIGPIVSRGRREKLLGANRNFGAAPPAWIRPEWAKRIDLASRWGSDTPSIDLRGFAQQQRYKTLAPPRRYSNWENTLAFAEQHGVEIRHPLHDLRLVRFFIGASGGMLQRHGQRKYLLREAMTGTLPELVRHRQTKADFRTSIIDVAGRLFAERPPEKMLVAELGWIDGAEIRKIHTANRRWREAGCPDARPGESAGSIWFPLAMDMWLEHAFKL
jgi:asparagine synthase (glutamine-hydrolysing)